MFKNYKSLLAIVLLFFTLQQANAQSVKISGVVTAKSDGQPLPGVSIGVKGTTTGTQTDFQGKFTIPANVNDILRISYIGFNPVEIPVNNSGEPLKIVLEEAPNSLNEVVVTALNISKDKKSLGYAVQGLKSRDISEAKETNLINALSGKIAGVNVTGSQGDMGSSRIIIRGETSVSGNNQPLFVVDGVIVDNSQFQGTNGSRDFANAISDLNSEDIESISVLKGPNAAALYGSRAAAGVILIKTKTGKGSKGAGITLNSNTTFATLKVFPDYQNEYGQGSNGKFSYVNGAGAGVNDGVDESWGPALDGRLIPQFFSNGQPAPFVAHPNNVRDFFKTGVTLNNGVSLAGSSDKFDYRLSYNNLNQTGVVPNSSQGKNSFLLNTTFRPNSKLTITTIANYIKDDADNLPGAYGRRATSTMLQFTWFGRQVDVNQLKNYRDANGNTFNWNNSYYSNPYFIAYENTVGQHKNRIIGSIELNYKIIEGLSANFRTGTDYYNDRRKIKIAYGTNGTPFGSYEEDAYTVNETNTEGRLQYTKKINKDFTFDGFVGGNISTILNEQNDQIAPKLAVAGLYTLSNSRDPLVSSNYYGKLKTYSYFASAQLGFRNYAFLNLTGRNDWSSTLPSSSLSYFYPSVNGSLILSEALDLKSNTLSYLKLRGGWSKVGKATTPYQLINTYNFTAPFGTNPQQSAASINLNPDLKPETTTSGEAGVEAGFFHDRVRLDLSVYNTNSVNQILNVDVSQTTGYSQKLINGGRINNKGLEVQLGLSPFKSKDFTWDVTVNYSRNKSKVISLDNEGKLQSYILGTNRTVQVLAAVGQPYGTLFGNAYTRDASGNIVIGANGTPVINPTKQYLGKYTPDWLGSINNSFTYKGVNLSFLVDARIGGSIYSNTNRTGTYTGVLASTLPGRGAANGGLSYYYPNNNTSAAAVQIAAGTSAPGGATVYDDGVIFKGVKADGTANTTILPAQSYYKGFTNVDEAFVYSASYVKLREVKLGYTFPSQWVKGLGLQSATVSLVGRNLWIIHKNVPNIDPETAFNTGNGQGLEDLTLPTVRNIGFNVNLKF
ncbi:SusC/RagA family TonB-linked outer membrane protein [Mucilaginibacter psychrotolerans]|uniref:SusC/RagA family TonB-linked outer membrane protein n=1 Tax=Mucilaginibacter psychrotolerans TaxID=1524096 RepID=A0A4Y8SCP5_9SPHI|nr:SusC/RagA family TonB-linked outer membrane protein [Mucilaginibacter psychrotolerans]TFF36370.1 SusC/RagA family TonB-linked outer membrane protein [Mucilaginibacter psychrotolerans]